MKGLLLVLRAESYRLLRSRSVVLACSFLAAVAALRVGAARMSEAAKAAQAVAAGRAIPEVMGGAGWAPFVEGWRAGLAATTLVLLIHAARGLAGDRAGGVLRLGSTRASTRVALVLGRALLAPVLVISAFLITGISALVASSLLYDFGPLVEEGYELMSVGELRAEVSIAALAALPPLMATYAFGMFVSALSRSAAGAISVALALFLAFDLFKEVLGPGQYWVFASFVPSVVDRSAMQEMTGVARGFSDAGFPLDLLRMNMLLPWPEALVLVLLAALVIRRKPL